MCILSKWIHIGGVGFVSLPEANVSADRRKLKSSGRNGFGIGTNGRIAIRRIISVKKTIATAKCFLRATCVSRRSIRANISKASLGHAKHVAMAMSVKPPSTKRREAPLPVACVPAVSGCIMLATACDGFCKNRDRSSDLSILMKSDERLRGERLQWFIQPPDSLLA